MNLLWFGPTKIVTTVPCVNLQRLIRHSDQPLPVNAYFSGDIASLGNAFSKAVVSARGLWTFGDGGKPESFSVTYVLEFCRAILVSD